MINTAFTAMPLDLSRMHQTMNLVMSSMAKGMPVRAWLRLCVLSVLAGSISHPAIADICPGNPAALGISRTLVVDARAHARIGTMQYAETLPLADHEVVLTFDDGPIPKYSNQILDILAAQCVKATFFVIGRMAREYPEGVRKLVAAGHTVGTHSQNHPLSMNHMPIDRAKVEIDDGIASVTAALGGSEQLAPFFRIPGLLRAEAVEDYLASQGIQTWSADFPADDWRHISSRKVHDLALSRIEAKGKGVLLLHDIQARTVAALPLILSDLKARGFRIVHVVPASPQRPATPTDPQQWQLHPILETVATSHWPRIPNFVYAGATTLPSPAMSASDQMLPSPEWSAVAQRRPTGSVPLPEPAPWPRPSPPPATNQPSLLPVPDHDLFLIAERVNIPFRPLPPLRIRAAASSAAATDDIARLISIDGHAARQSIPGSMPVTQPGLQPQPK